MKDISPKIQIFLLSLIPCLFTIVNLLFSFILPSAIILVWVLCIIWIWVGWKSCQQLHNYGKALIFLNWMGFLCMIFAFMYYSKVSVKIGDLYWIDGIWLPIHISNYMIGDIFAGLYSSPFLIGGLANWGLFNFEIDMCIVNTATGLAMFTIGYIASVIQDLIQHNMKVKAKV